MPPYDDWNKADDDDDDDDELQDSSLFESRRDVILFCIDCAPSMHVLRDDPAYDAAQSSHLLAALDAAIHIQKNKVVVGPTDSVGILLFNTTRFAEAKGTASEIKKNTFLYQPIAQINAPTIQQLIQLVDAAREDPSELTRAFPPLTDRKLPLGDVFTSCNWVLRDGAPKTASKRVFLITDDDNPHAGARTTQLLTSARTTLEDLTQSGASVEPFFIATDEKPFDLFKFYSSVLETTAEEGEDAEGMLPAHLSITRIDDLLAQMRVHEMPKRALFSVPLELAPGFVVSVKGYGLVTEQKRGAYRYFVDLGDRMEVAGVRTVYLDEGRQAEVDKTKLLYGPALGGPAGGGEDSEGEDEGGEGTRAVKAGRRPFYTADELKSFRTLGLEPGIKLLGFKHRRELAFEDNIRHSTFIYPDEMTYAGSKRAFTALLRSMLAKKRIAIVRALFRRNSTPVFCALLPQAEKVEEGGWSEPAGMHLVPLPFADDIRAAPVDEALRASDELKDAARAWIDKLSVKNGTYPPDSYPNPALAHHHAQLQASAFREEWDPEAFEDLTLPKLDMVHKRAGALIKAWKTALVNDPSAELVTVVKAGAKRKADVSVDEAEIRSKYEAGTLSKLRVDQLREFLRIKGEDTSGKKGELVERVAGLLESRA